MRIIIAFAIGLLFGLGVTIAGMIDPAKVINFFDLAGNWDPSLAFVMGGALLVTVPGYRLVWRASAPVCAPKFSLPTSTDLTARLFIGAAIFGVGWGLAGFCPGAVLPALSLGVTEVYLFAAACLVGMLGTRKLI